MAAENWLIIGPQELRFRCDARAFSRAPRAPHQPPSLAAAPAAARSPACWPWIASRPARSAAPPATSDLQAAAGGGGGGSGGRRPLPPPPARPPRLPRYWLGGRCLTAAYLLTSACAAHCCAAPRRFELRKNVPCTLTLQNPTGERVAFKVKTTSPKKYCVRPSSGIVEPGSSKEVQVIMQAQREYPPSLAGARAPPPPLARWARTACRWRWSRRAAARAHVPVFLHVSTGPLPLTHCPQTARTSSWCSA